VGTRAASAIAKTVAAGLLWLSSDGCIREIRFALGSMAPTVRRLGSVENLLAGKKPTAKLVEEAAALLENDVSPIDDLRSTRAYRLEVSRNLLRAFLGTGLTR
jgi:CO/xanthine dehydrogenase FAD-binding subunit